MVKNKIIAAILTTAMMLTSVHVSAAEIGDYSQISQKETILQEMYSGLVSDTEPVTDSSITQTPELQLPDITESVSSSAIQKIKVKAVGSNNKVKFNWNKVNRSKYYAISSLSKKGKWKTVADKIKKNKKNITLKSGTKCKYKIFAYNSSGKIIGESEAIIVFNPDKVKQLKYILDNGKIANLTWAKKKTAKLYNIYKKNTKGKYELLKSTRKTKIKVKTNSTYKVAAVYKTKDAKVEGKGNTIKPVCITVVSTDHSKYTYAEMITDMNMLQKQFKGKCVINSIGTTNDNRAIKEIVVGNINAKKCLMVVGAIHAREYMTTQLCMKQAEYYLQNYDAKLFKKICIRFVPMANPDGVSISQFGIKAIRNSKLRSSLAKYHPSSSWKSNARGVDLNRNFPNGYRAGYGSRGSEGYSGTYSASEPETKALINWVSKHKSRVKGVVNYHAMGNIVFGDTTSRMTASERVVTGKMYSIARRLTGYSSSAGYNAGQPTVGNFREYVMENQKIPSITLETGSSGCPVPGYQFEGIWSRNKNVVLEVARLLA